MNPRLAQLHPYPFERLDQLLAAHPTAADSRNIPLSLGEPKHSPPAFIVEAMKGTDIFEIGVSAYPATGGTEELKRAIAAWLSRRYGIPATAFDPISHILPVNGTREALFAFAQATVAGGQSSVVLMPNPFYQIYEGAATLSGSRAVYLNCTERTGFKPDFAEVESDVWQRCEILYLCTPGNPTGVNIDSATFARLIALADEFDFTIASDECYSEIYQDDGNRPTGLLEACHELGRSDFQRCIVFNSLSKRSNLPGLRSGFVAGDAELIRRFLLYRTYHGSAMPVHTQMLSKLAWEDEDHVVSNRQLYRDKFAAVVPILAGKLAFHEPESGFYLWPETPIDDQRFAVELVKAANVTVLPGSFLARSAHDVNPGDNHVRMALVATLEDCVEAAERIARFLDDSPFA